MRNLPESIRNFSYVLGHLPQAAAMTFSDEQPVGEVSATELGKTVGAVLKRVDAGERIVVTRNGHDVALIVSFEAGIEVMLAGSERFAAMRREARDELEAGIAKVLEAWRVGTASS